MRSIAIEREFGSGGREVGRLVAEQLGMPFYDGEILFNTAERSGMDLGQLRNFDERQAGSLLFELALATNPNPYSARTHLYEMFEALQGTIRQLAQNGLVYSGIEYDRERYGEILALSHRIAALASTQQDKQAGNPSIFD